MARRRNPQSIKQFAPGSPEGNPLVYFDVSIGSGTTKRLHIELLHDTVPRTCENIRLLCTGEVKQFYGAGSISTDGPTYRGNPFHRIIPGFMMQGGDILNDNGTGGKAAFQNASLDENFILKHGIGSLSMAHQNNSNKSQFFISFNEASWLDGKHVVFGQVLKEDLEFLKLLEKLGTESGRPLKPVVIKNCGQICGFGMTTNLEEKEDEGDIDFDII